MTIKDYTEYKEAEILRLYAEVGWTAYTDAPDTLRKGFENSLLTLAAYEQRFWGWFARWATDIPLYLCRIFWCVRTISGRESALRCCGQYLNDMPMCGRSNL